MSLRDKLKNANVAQELKLQGFSKDSIADILLANGVSSAAEVTKLLKMRDGLLKRSKKATEKRKEVATADLGYIQKLTGIVGTNGNRDVTFSGWASTAISAEEYIKSKKMQGWSVKTQDLDGDDIPEVLLYDDENNIRKVNGWGVKESSKPIRDDYYTNNPSITSRKHITQGEWTSAMKVDNEGNIGYLYPEAVRYKKSRQEYYTKHEHKIPKPDIKRVWQQYVAKPFIHMNKALYPDEFKGLSSLPGMAAATLSQHFSMHAYTFLKLACYTSKLDEGEFKNSYLEVIIKIKSGYYGDEAYEQDRKNNNKTLKWIEKQYPAFNQFIHDKVIELADAMSKANSMDDLLKGTNKTEFSDLQTIFNNTYTILYKNMQKMVEKTF